MEETVQQVHPKLYPHDKLLRAVILPFVPQFVKPNYVTAFRLLFTPVVYYLLFTEQYAIGIIAFLIAAFSDALDGTLARVRNQITPWGIFFDPVADKLLIGGVALLVALQYYHPAIVFLAIVLDILPSVLWASTRRGGTIMMANWWGKTKMILQVTSITLLLLGLVFALPALIAAGQVALILSLFFAAVAVVTYSL